VGDLAGNLIVAWLSTFENTSFGVERLFQDQAASWLTRQAIRHFL
jgi:hypothetical protein